jgi:translation elongation factor EF-4
LHITTLSQDRRGELIEMNYLDNTRILFKYKIPFAEITTNLFDALKEMTSGTKILFLKYISIAIGYATFEYDDAGYQETEIVKVISTFVFNKMLIFLILIGGYHAKWTQG